MASVAADWESVDANRQIRQCIPLFRGTDLAHYQKMSRSYCRNKLDDDARLMHLWRRTDIDWRDRDAVLKRGLALAFYVWRPRNEERHPIDHRWTVCLFLGSELAKADFIDAVIAAAKKFAQDYNALDRVYIVKDANHTYPPKVDDVFNDQKVQDLLAQQPNYPEEHGWPERLVWKVARWP